MSALDAHGFFDIKMFEVLQRVHDVKKIAQSGWIKQVAVAKVRNFSKDAVKRPAEEIPEAREIKLEDLFTVTRPSVDMRGHTSYLTFAKYLRSQGP